jgi:hypothetical protein
MFYFFLLVTLITALVVSAVVVASFRKPTLKIFQRIIGEDLAASWHKFLLFALYVVGVSSGVNLRKLEQYVFPSGPESEQVRVLTSQAWGFEIFRTILSTLGGLAWALFVFFVIALIAFAIIKMREAKQSA